MGGSGGVVVGAQGWGGGAYEVVVVVGLCDHETRGGEGFGSKYPKLSCYGSVSGALCRGGGMVRMRWWWWWDCVIMKQEAGRGLGQNT